MARPAISIPIDYVIIYYNKQLISIHGLFRIGRTSDINNVKEKHRILCGIIYLRNPANNRSYYYRVYFTYNRQNQEMFQFCHLEHRYYI